MTGNTRMWRWEYQDEDVEKLTSSYFASDCGHLQNLVAMPPTTKHLLPYDILVMVTKIRAYLQQKTCTRMFLSALFIIAPSQNSLHMYYGKKHLKIMKYLYTIMSSIKKEWTGEASSPRKIWVNLKNMMMGQRCQT